MNMGKSEKPQALTPFNKRQLVLMECKLCLSNGVMVSKDVKSVICGRCTAQQVDPPEVKPPKTDDDKRPKGWHLKKEYISPSGKIYHRGREVNELSTKSTPDS
jgi:hypothetical protein